MMAIYWMTEVLPLAVTCLLPLCLFPFLKILDADATASAYFNDTIFLFVGSFIVAIAMEKWNLHRRIALKLLLMIGHRPRILLLGLMLTTGFLSMWMSNTSVAGLMVPLVMTILNQLTKEDDEEEAAPTPQIVETEDTALLSEREDVVEAPEIEETEGKLSEDEINRIKEINQKYCKAVLLGIAYAASIGGTSTIIGTGPNLILKQQLKIIFPLAPEINFLQWFLFGFPLAFIFLIISWGVFLLLYVKDPSKIHFDESSFRRQYQALGIIKSEEIAVIVSMGIMVTLWFSRVGFEEDSPGWGKLFSNLPGDGTVAMIASFLLFLIPSKRSPANRVMDWESLKDIPWGIILLLGSGFSLAKAFHTSGLSTWIGEGLSIFKDLPWFVVLFAVCLMITMATEFTIM